MSSAVGKFVCSNGSVPVIEVEDIRFPIEARCQFQGSQREENILFSIFDGIGAVNRGARKDWWTFIRYTGIWLIVVINTGRGSVRMGEAPGNYQSIANREGGGL
jgi:hypothetical protein